MSDPFGPGKCIEADLNATMGLLDSAGYVFNPNVFLNPQAVTVLNMRQGNDNAWAKYFAVKNLLQVSPEDAPHLAQLETLWQKVPDMITAYETWTNFLSGKSHVFPLADLDPGQIYGHWDSGSNSWLAGVVPPGYLMLGTLTFAGLLGVAHSSRAQAHVTCNTDPNDPCAKVTGIFGAILGAYNSVLNAIADGLGQIQDFMGKVSDIITQIAGYLTQLAHIIASALDKLIAAITDAIKYGLAKLLKALGIDPCMQQVLGQICGPALKTSIGL